MSFAEMNSMQSALTDLGKQFNRLSERLDSQDSVLKVKVYSISQFIQSSCLYLTEFNCFILIRFGQTVLSNQNAMNSSKPVLF